MKQLLFVTILFLTTMTTGVLQLQAQVTVGMNSEPEKGAALEIKEWDVTIPNSWKLSDLANSKKGILFPKVELVAYDSLLPLYEPPYNDAVKTKSIGMIVYNIANIPGVEIGLTQWDGEEWKPLSGGSSGIAAVVCSSNISTGAVVNGYYTKNTPLNQSNTIVLPVNVTKTGSYSARIVVYEGSSAQEAPFSFTAMGEFMQIGEQYITFQGQGIPVKHTGEVASDANIDPNKLEMYVNGKRICPDALPKITIEKTKAIFTFNCTSTDFVTKNSDIKVNTITRGDSDKLQIKLSFSSTSAGATYHIQTDSVNGMKFSATGVLTAGNNDIRLDPSGKMLKSGTYLYTITGNSAGINTTCTVKIDVVFEGINILLLSYGANWNLNATNAAIPLMTKNPAIFDLGTNPNAPFHAANGSISITGSSSTSWSKSDLEKYHLIVLSWQVIPTDALAKDLCELVKSGKTTVLFTVDKTSGSAQMTYIINYLSGLQTSPLAMPESSLCKVDGSGGYDNFPFVGGNLAVNGKYMDLTGKHLGRDGGQGSNFTVDLTDSRLDDWVVLATTTDALSNPRSKAKLLMHKKYRMFLSGDGGIFSGGSPNMSGYGSIGYHAATVDYSGNPEPATKNPFFGQAYNAHFLANLMIWAFEAATE